MVTVIYYSQKNCNGCLTFDPIWNRHQSQHPTGVDFKIVILAKGVRNPHNVRETPTVIISRDNGATIDSRLVSPSEAELHGAIVKSISNQSGSPTPTGGSYSNPIPWIIGLLVTGKIFKIF